MNNRQRTNTIEELRRNGWKVRVTHYRRYYDLDQNRRPVVKELPRYESPGLMYALPNGGRTEMTVTDGHTTYTVSTECGNHQFNKRIAINTLLGRLRKNHPEVFTANETV